MSSLIQLNNVCVQFGTRTILNDISLTLERGEIITVIGPNGAGKSTLVKVLVGLQKVSSGAIIRHPKIQIGYVPQKLKLNDTLPLDVSRFLRLAGKYSKQEIMVALSLVGAEHLESSNMHSLSGGENQRVLLARALLTRPDILILDEPAQGVDIQGQVDLYELIDSIRLRFNCSVVMISHDLHLVMAKTDHVICLHHHICCSGTPQHISQHPDYIALFGQKTKESLAFYQHEHTHHHDLSGGVVAGDVNSCKHYEHHHD